MLVWVRGWKGCYFGSLFNGRVFFVEILGVWINELYLFGDCILLWCWLVVGNVMNFRFWLVVGVMLLIVGVGCYFLVLVWLFVGVVWLGFCLRWWVYWWFWWCGLGWFWCFCLYCVVFFVLVCVVCVWCCVCVWWFVLVYFCLL